MNRQNPGLARGVEDEEAEVKGMALFGSGEDVVSVGEDKGSVDGEERVSDGSEDDGVWTIGEGARGGRERVIDRVVTTLMKRSSVCVEEETRSGVSSSKALGLSTGKRDRA